MDKLKNFLKKWDIGLVFGIGLSLLGLILLILPGSSLTTVCTILGVGVALKGGIKLFNYLKAKQIEAEKNSDLVSAIVFLVSAFILIAHPKKLISIIPMLIGIGIIVYGASSFFKAPTLFSKIISAVIFVVGLGIVGSPFAFAEAVTAVLGVALIIVGVMVAVKHKNTVTLRIEGNGDDGYTEVEFKDVE